MVTAVTVTLVTLIAVLYVVTKNNLLENYAMLERLELREDLLRVENAITARGDALSTLVKDWASWDDSYEFIETRSEAFIDSNLVEVTYTDAGLRLIAFADTDGTIVFSRALSAQSGELEQAPAPFLDQLTDERLLQRTPDASAHGILVTDDEVLLVAAQPLLDSEGEGPVRGTLIMAQSFETSVIPEVARVATMDIAVARVDSPSLPPDFVAARDALPAVGADALRETHFETSGDSRIAVYKLLGDVFGAPSHLLRLQAPRTIYASAENSLGYFLVSLVVVGLVLLLVVVYLLDRLVLLPLSRLNRHVTHVTESGDLTLPYRPPGGAELSQLADNIRLMLDEIRRARNDLEQVNERLERRVDERTIELVQARDEAVDALRVKDRILANVSHDSRTPLNTIMLRAELMKAGRYGPLSEAQTGALDGIVAGVNQLTIFTTNLLYEAQSAAGRFDLLGERIDLEAELARIIDMMKPLAERKHLALELDIPPDVDLTMDINRQAMHQVMANLIDNAIKFTDSGRVDVRVRSAAGNRVSITVADTGKGIPEHLHGHIFDAFWQVDSSVTREANRGVGLGLSIVRMLVDRLGGNVVVRPAEGGGTVFTVELPRGGH